jgi:hypothetical protein
MLAPRSVIERFSHVTCVMVRVPGLASKTFKHACMLGVCPHCGWNTKLDYGVDSVSLSPDKALNTVECWLK